MPATQYTPGFKFTFTLDGEDYTAQVESLGVNKSNNGSIHRFLGGSLATSANQVVIASQKEYSEDVRFAYDGATGFYLAADTAFEGLVTVEPVVEGGGGTWTGTGLFTALGAETAAEDDLMTCTATLLLSSNPFAASTP